MLFFNANVRSCVCIRYLLFRTQIAVLISCLCELSTHKEVNSTNRIIYENVASFYLFMGQVLLGVYRNIAHHVDSGCSDVTLNTRDKCFLFNECG